MNHLGLAHRILERCIPVPESGCWLWEGRVNRAGYGRLSVGNKTCGAHRISYQAFVGDPGNLDVCHKCDVPACVNPKHLFLGTASDNAIDSVRKKRNAQSKKTTCLKGHPYDFVDAAGARQCSTCLREYRRKNRPYFRQKVREWRARQRSVPRA